MRSVREWLLALDTCAVSDALDSLGRSGAVSGVLPVWEGARLAGRVVTMRTVPADGRVSGSHLGTAAIERAEEGEVVVVEQAAGPPYPSATWGGLLAKAAVVKGLGGIVVDGACRDVDEIRELGLAVSAREAIPFTARGRIVEDGVGLPILIGGVTVREGDFVLADGSGVVFVREEDVGAVLTVAERLAAREALMAADLRAGRLPSEVLGKDYEEMLDE
ncbi:4-carboxy-4-hydroxy-2-oxoadipate aldolase/oxaloacetate decarboxylase [Amycolatopsis rhabdoformis]|uniref:Putative 4-hydroxy-4-methyl-2-oxoglutarate aldolase n=1 Tax=Amycolatopsis rhabdoformis TaxID=1448059 RepID=A0ABZ1ID76_9PSEU|nr:4-carboxy-4-hydroxy-2-oxoadipate aldolase/oxaloacetate decarboxylase [Amycolatopsis rhabdoformis]WSE32212.1 4-carboxy-4-hydroxy-2-oxoadipate aldolase/oxaloacetate decarboxylase [Amycolatopsis rhabdoformis]